MLRPENLRVLAPNEQADNHLLARLGDVIMLGQVTKYYATLTDGSYICASQLTQPGQPDVRAGDEVRFGFERHSTICLPFA